MLRDRLRIRFEREHGVGGRERVEGSVADRFQNIFKLGGREFLETRGEFAREHGEILRICAERLVEIGDAGRIVLSDPILGDQFSGVVLLPQNV